MRPAPAKYFANLAIELADARVPLHHSQLPSLADRLDTLADAAAFVKDPADGVLRERAAGLRSKFDRRLGLTAGEVMALTHLLAGYAARLGDDSASARLAPGLEGAA